MPVTCTTDSLMDSAKCFNCLTPIQQLAIQTYLLAVQAGGSTDASVLLSSAKCFLCLPQQQLLAIQAYLLCQIANS